MILSVVWLRSFEWKNGMPLNIGMGREGNNESGKAAHGKASGCGKQCTSLYCFLIKHSSP